MMKSDTQILWIVFRSEFGSQIIEKFDVVFKIIDHFLRFSTLVVKNVSKFLPIVMHEHWVLQLIATIECIAKK